MTKVMIPLEVLDSIEGVVCEFLRPVDVSEPDSPEQFCDQWIHAHLELEVEAVRVRQLEHRGLSEFEAMRRVAVEMSAENWVRIHDGPPIKAVPTPKHASVR